MEERERRRSRVVIRRIATVERNSLTPLYRLGKRFCLTVPFKTFLELEEFAESWVVFQRGEVFG